jgi:hypothetical protein
MSVTRSRRKRGENSRYVTLVQFSAWDFLPQSNMCNYSSFIRNVEVSWKRVSRGDIATMTSVFSIDALIEATHLHIFLSKQIIICKLGFIVPVLCKTRMENVFQFHNGPSYI